MEKNINFYFEEEAREEFERDIKDLINKYRIEDNDFCFGGLRFSDILNFIDYLMHDNVCLKYDIRVIKALTKKEMAGYFLDELMNNVTCSFDIDHNPVVILKADFALKFANKFSLDNIEKYDL